MSIDPSIPLSVRPYESKSPMQSLGQMMQLRAFQQQNEDRALVGEKNRRALQAQDAFQRAVQVRQGDYDAAVKDLELGGFADEAMSVRTTLFEQRKKIADNLKVTLDNRTAAFTQGSRLLQGVTTPEQYAAVLPEIRSLVGPDLAQQIPDAFDPEFVAQVVQWGMSAADVSGRLSAAASSLNAGIALKKEGRDADKEFTASLAGWLPHVGSQEEWTQALQTAQQAGAPPSVLAKFGEQFSPEAAQKAAVLGMTPEQITQRAEQARQDTETRRHNITSEATARLAATAPQYSKVEITDVSGKSRLANYDARSGKYFDPDTNAVIVGAKPAPTADMKNKTEGRKFVARSISAIENLSKKILTKVGPAQRAEAIKRGAEAVFGSDPEFRTYQDARTAMAGNLAVAQQGSRPSDADIRAIWLPMVPDAYRDTSESAEMKWNLIRTMSLPEDEGQSSPAATGPKVGDIGTVKGQRVKVTKLYPDGTFDYEVVK